MAYPATALSLADALAQADAAAIRLRKRVQERRDESFAGDVPRHRYIDLLRIITQAITVWESVSDVPGIGLYAQAQKNDPTLDVVAEFQAMTTAATNLRQWVFDNLPTHTDGGISLVTVSLAGTETPIVVGQGGRNQFINQADAFLSTVS